MPIDLTLGLETSVVVVTGAAGQIGQVVIEAFLEAGCLGLAGLDIDVGKCARQHERLLWDQVDTMDEVAM